MPTNAFVCSDNRSASGLIYNLNCRQFSPKALNKPQPRLRPNTRLRGPCTRTRPTIADDPLVGSLRNRIARIGTSEAYFGNFSAEMYVTVHFDKRKICFSIWASQWDSYLRYFAAH